MDLSLASLIAHFLSFSAPTFVSPFFWAPLHLTTGKKGTGTPLSLTMENYQKLEKIGEGDVWTCLFILMARDPS